MRSVLIVEDEKISSLFLETLLSGLGYNVSGTAITGEEAIRKADAFPPDLVIMDVGLKGDMVGTQAARIIQQRHGVPVLFITAYRHDELLRNNHLPNTFAILAKPIVERELKEKLKSIFSLPQ